MFIQLVWFSFLFATEFCHLNYAPPKSYQKLESFYSSQLEALANRPIFASEADLFLSKLIGVKSPLIIKWINERKLNPLTQTDLIAKKWRIYYLENFGIGKFLKLSGAQKKEVEQFLKQVDSLGFTTEEKKKIKVAFEEAKLRSLETIKLFNLPKSVKDKILEKISSVELYWFEKIAGTKFEVDPREYISWGIAYDPKDNKINLGIKALSYNQESLFAVFAHEFAHTFDPCRWGLTESENFPFQEVTECLRSKESVGAKKRDDSLFEELLKQGKVSSELAVLVNKAKTCNSNNYPPVGKQKDQINETFADWFSAEVVSLTEERINSNLRIDLCEKTELDPGSSYIENQARLYGIYLTAPRIGKKLNSNTHFKYCNFKKI